LAALRWEAESPTRFTGSTLLFTVLKSGDAFRVLLASSPLGGAFLLNALLGVSESNCSYLYGLRNLAEAFICISALGDIDCCLATLGWEAESPTRSFGSTLLFTVLKSGDAFGVLLAGSPLGGTFLLNALLGVSESDSSFLYGLRNLAKAFIGISALGDIDCCLAALGWEAESPARSFGSTLLFTVLKSGDAFGVLLTGSPLGGTFLFNALLGVSDGNSS